MAGYIRQSSFVDGDTITAAIFNNEYNQLLNAFNNATGHAHDGTAAEGPVIGLIGDAGETSPNNKVLIDTTNNFIEFYVEVSSAPVQQLYIADGALVPVTDSDVDLGTTSLRFKDTYTDTITTTGNVDVGGNLTVTGTTTFNGGTITMGDAATDNVVFGADIDSHIIPDDDDTYDLGSSTQQWRNLYVDGTANLDTVSIEGDATFADSAKAIFGAGSDLQIYHDGSNSYIADAGTGLFQLRTNGSRIEMVGQSGSEYMARFEQDGAVKLYYDNSQKLATTSTGVDVTGVITTDGLTTSADINFGDNDKAIFGAGSDLQIYHDGSNSYIKDAGTGSLLIDATNLYFRNASGEEYASFIADGAANLKYNGSTKIVTSSTGIDVTGVVSATSISVGDSHTIGNDGFDNLEITSSTSENIVIKPAESVYLYNAGAAKLTTTATGIDVTGIATMDGLTVENSAGFGSIELGGTSGGLIDLKSPMSDDFDLRIITSGTGGQINSGSGEVAIQRQGATKLATTSTGIDVTGTATMDGLTINDSGVLRLNDDATTDFFTIQQGATQAVLTADSPDGAGNMVFRTTSAGVDNDRMLISANGDISFYEDTGTTAQMTWDASADALTFVDNAKAIFGAGSDLQIYHDGVNSFIKDAGTGNLRINADDFTLTNAANDSNLLSTFNGTVFLYHNSNLKLNTTSTGIDVTGTATMDGLDSSGTAFIRGASAGRINLDDSGVADSSQPFKFLSSDGGSLIFGTANRSGTSTTSSTELAKFDSSGNFGINVSSPSRKFEVDAGAPQIAAVIRNTSTDGVRLGFQDANTTGDNYVNVGAAGNDFVAYAGGGEKFRIDSSGNVGIGTDSPDTMLDISHARSAARPTISSGTRLLIESTANTSAFTDMSILGGNSSGASRINFGDVNDENVGQIGYYHADNSMRFVVNASERARIDSSGSLLVGTTTTDRTADDGITANGVGFMDVSRSSNISGRFTRRSSDGSIIDFRKDSTSVGSIGTRSSGLVVGNGDVGLFFDAGVDRIFPESPSGGAARDNAIDLGTSGARFKDLYLSGTITNDGTGGISIDTSGNVGIGTTSPTTQVTASQSANISQVAITSSSNAVAWNATAAANAYHVTTENTTFSAPSNAVEGAIISVEIAQGGTARTVAWNTVFEFAASTAPTVTAEASKTDIFSFRYNGSVWQEIGRVQNLAQT